MPLVPVKQPAIMRVRKPGQMIANTMKAAAPQVMHGSMFIEIDPSDPFVIGMRAPANTNIARVHGHFNGVPRRYIGRFTVNQSDNTILAELGPYSEAGFGDSIDVLVDDTRQVILPWRESSNRYEATQSGFFSFMVARQNMTVPIITFYQKK